MPYFKHLSQQAPASFKETKVIEQVYSQCPGVSKEQFRSLLKLSFVRMFNLEDPDIAVLWRVTSTLATGLVKCLKRNLPTDTTIWVSKIGRKPLGWLPGTSATILTLLGKAWLAISLKLWRNKVLPGSWFEAGCIQGEIYPLSLSFDLWLISLHVGMTHLRALAILEREREREKEIYILQ